MILLTKNTTDARDNRDLYNNDIMVSEMVLDTATREAKKGTEREYRSIVLGF